MKKSWSKAANLIQTFIEDVEVFQKCLKNIKLRVSNKPNFDAYENASSAKVKE